MVIHLAVDAHVQPEWLGCDACHRLIEVRVQQMGELVAGLIVGVALSLPGSPASTALPLPWVGTSQPRTQSRHGLLKPSLHVQIDDEIP